MKPTYKWDLRNGDFEEFKEQVEKELPNNYNKKSTEKLEKILRKTINKAARKHIKKKKVNPRSMNIMTEEISNLIKERNELRKNGNDEATREAWIKKCQEVQEEIRKEKEKRWKAYINSIEATTNSKEIWRTIRNIEGRSAPRKDNEILIVEKKG